MSPLLSPSSYHWKKITKEMYDKQAEKGINLVCKECRQDLKVGEIVLKTNSYGTWWHEECWKNYKGICAWEHHPFSITNKKPKI